MYVGRKMETEMSDYIVASPDILGGKPCIKGTRISVEHILELFASGANRQDILSAFPQVTPDALNAALEYAAHSMRNEVVWDIKVSA